MCTQATDKRQMCIVGGAAMKKKDSFFILLSCNRWPENTLQSFFRSSALLISTSKCLGHFKEGFSSCREADQLLRRCVCVCVRAVSPAANSALSLPHNVRARIPYLAICAGQLPSNPCQPPLVLATLCTSPFPNPSQ